MVFRCMYRFKKKVDLFSDSPYIPLFRMLNYSNHCSLYGFCLLATYMLACSMQVTRGMCVCCVLDRQL